MLVSQNKPNHITLMNVIGACAKIASMEMGNQVHCYIMKTGHVLDVYVLNGLIDMYIKCGSLEIARELFDFMEDPNVVSWSSLIVGHVGLVEEGLQLYRNMETEYGIIPSREHCSCVVDLLARAGHIHEAEAFINQMALDPGVEDFASCLYPTNSAAPVLLCNIYASSKRWDDVARLRSSMKEMGLRKIPGEDIVVPLTRLCCPLSLVVAQSLKTQVSYFLDELSMLYSANTCLQSAEQV
ncbi:hypothetical protein EZV62_016969 [Acer yangbiense]|uniref:DYW domain-containing protein n=1 Tax=Acer yangbiense TaxID=1000413 RepID=A0A5C7HQ25_9ROSI|nr:hypothetical protein EZV62_016969 [Acer yangbiense]